MASTKKSGVKLRRATAASAPAVVEPRRGRYDPVVEAVNELPLTKKNTLILDVPSDIRATARKTAQAIFRHRMTLLVIKRVRKDRTFSVYKTENGKVAIQRTA